MPFTYPTFRTIISFLVRICLFGGGLYALWISEWAFAVLAFFSSVITYLPTFLEKKYKVFLPAGVELVLSLFIFSAVFLGEAGGFYTLFWWWDVFLHGLSGIILGMLGFILLFVLYEREKIEASPILIGLFTFCFAVALGTFWEIFEFISDIFLGTNLQTLETGVVDTMQDLILDSLGALVVSILGYLYLKYNHTNLVRIILEKFKDHNPHMFTKIQEKIKHKKAKRKERKQKKKRKKIKEILKKT